MLGRLVFGGAPIGNLFEIVAEQDAMCALETAWQFGVRHFDTAPHYGLGLSELRLGQFLAGKPRDQFTISTKVGRLLEPSSGVGDDLDNGFAVPANFTRTWRGDYQGVKASLEQSLERLQLDAVDTLYLHDPDESGDDLEQSVDTGLASLVRLRESGVVERIGIGSKSEAALYRALEHPIDELMCSNRYTLVDRSAADRVLPKAQELGVSVLAVSVYSSGLLARPRPGRHARDEYGPVSPARRHLANQFADIAEAHGTDLPTVALQFPTRNPAVESIAVGARTATQLRESIERLRHPVPRAAWYDIDQIVVPT